jgi:hypothetical protein
MALQAAWATSSRSFFDTEATRRGVNDSEALPSRTTLEAVDISTLSTRESLGEPEERNPHRD